MSHRTEADMSHRTGADVLHRTGADMSHRTGADMSHRTGVDLLHRTGTPEIFSKESRWKDNVFMFDKQELKQQIQLSNTDVLAPTSPMKKFGSYKPKILVEETDFVERENNDHAVFNEPKFTTTSQGASSSNFKNHLRVQPAPWVVGKKPEPMFLVNANTPDKDYDIVKDPQPNKLNKYNISRQNEIDNINKSQRVRPASHGSFNSNRIKFDTITEDIYENDQDGIPYTADDSLGTADISSSSISRAYSVQNLQEINPDGVLIPAPDYDEEEQLVYFNSEETDRGKEGGNPGLMTAKLPVKMYDGADLSVYLNDDDAEEHEVAISRQSKAGTTFAKRVKSETNKPKIFEKYSFFKQYLKIKDKKTPKEKVTSKLFNTVRNFSYANSKSVTLGNSSLDNSTSVSSTANEDGERFLQTNDHRSSYEMFLRSRHGDVSLEEPAARSGSAGEVSGGNVSPGHRKQHKVWKKFTLRFKHAVIRGLPVKEHSSSGCPSLLNVRAISESYAQ